MGKLTSWAQTAARLVFRPEDPELARVREYIGAVQRNARILKALRGAAGRAYPGHLTDRELLLYAQAKLTDPMLPEAERQRLRQILLVGTAANRRERRAAIRQVRRERVAAKRRKHEARGRKTYLRAMSARYVEV